MNEQELRNLMYTAQLKDQGTWSIRYPRGQGVMPQWKTKFEKVEIGKGRVISAGDDIAIVSIGHVGNYAVDAIKRLEQENISAAHYDMRFVKPLDEELLHQVFKKFSKVITVEDGCLPGGFGSAVVEFMADNGYFANVQRLGIPDRFIDHGSQKELHLECGYYKDDIVEAAIKLVGIGEKAAAG
jgi:1-deoxy-D-xylulose-5-phosphate synthase